MTVFSLTERDRDEAAIQIFIFVLPEDAALSGQSGLSQGFTFSHLDFTGTAKQRFQSVSRRLNQCPLLRSLSH